MNRIQIEPEKLLIRAVNLWKNQWLVLTSGDYNKGDYNAMTVAWGSFGVMWNKPFAQVVVRPTRFTHQFMEKYDSFSLCAFSSSYQQALSLLGSKSGRNTDKIKQSGLTPISSHKIAAPCFKEAELIIECQKIYWDDFRPEHFLENEIEKNYPKKDYHRIYYGEMVTILGDDKFRFKMLI